LGYPLQREPDVQVFRRVSKSRWFFVNSTILAASSINYSSKKENPGGLSKQNQAIFPIRLESQASSEALFEETDNVTWDSK
jgi:hypothetical protein